MLLGKDTWLLSDSDEKCKNILSEKGWVSALTSFSGMHRSECFKSFVRQVMERKHWIINVYWQADEIFICSCLDVKRNDFLTS
jgi:hypothetical protein